MSTQPSVRRLTRRKRAGIVATWTAFTLMALGMIAGGVALLVLGVHRVDAIGELTHQEPAEHVRNILIFLLSGTLILGTPAAYLCYAREDLS
ncbi:hypothetical protein [Kribbella sp. NPDC003557]|uniref:hypothetical protein n=1 Tax=Kribbella sp. NPDC003557 TaxID=3154449 RepID=UPI0033A763A6